MGMFTGYPLIKKFDRTPEMCHLPSNEQQLLVILGYNREIKINCEKSKRQIQWSVPLYENETKSTLFILRSLQDSHVVMLV